MNSDWLLPGATKDTQSITADRYPTNRALIDGVFVKDIRNVPKGNGLLTEMFRNDWFDRAEPVAHVFQVMLLAGSVSAWHAHALTTDRLFVTQGMVRIVLYDARRRSPTRGMINEFVLSLHRPFIVVIPPQVWHGAQTVSAEPGVIMNMADRVYQYDDPDHWRLAPDTSEIPYRFKQTSNGEGLVSSVSSLRSQVST